MVYRPLPLLYGCILSSTRLCAALYVLGGTAGCASTRALLSAIRRHQTAASPVSSSSLTFMTTTPAVPPPISVNTTSYVAYGVSLDTTPQLMPMNLVPLEVSPVLTGHYMADLLLLFDGSEAEECFLSSCRQNIPLSGCRELKPVRYFGHRSLALSLCSPEVLGHP